METEYDPEHEAVAAMKLAAEADGAERQRWINAALAWIELTRLRVSGRERSGAAAGAVIQVSTSSGVVRITGIAFGWIGPTSEFGSVVRNA